MEEDEKERRTDRKERELRGMRGRKEKNIAMSTERKTKDRASDPRAPRAGGGERPR